MGMLNYEGKPLDPTLLPLDHKLCTANEDPDPLPSSNIIAKRVQTFLALQKVLNELDDDGLTSPVFGPNIARVQKSQLLQPKVDQQYS